MTVLVLDIGSSSVRALLFNQHAHAIPDALIQIPYQFTTQPSGAATLSMLDLQANIEYCIEQILQHPQASSIRVVGMATFAGNILGLAIDGTPATPVYTYADTRSAQAVAVLKTRISEQHFHHRTGCLCHTAYAPGRLSWLRRANPLEFAAVARWSDIGAYLYQQWFGLPTPITSYSIASWNGLLNRAALTWDAEWLDLLQLSEAKLPLLKDYDSMLTGLAPVYAARWPSLKNVPFCLAVGDGAAANIGVGCINEEHVALTVGTTAAMRVVTSTALPPVPDGLWSYRVNANLHLVGGATSEGGNIFHWVNTVLDTNQLANFEDTLAQRPPDAHQLTFLPLLAGERSPGWATQASGALIGLRLSTTPLDIAQAALEGVALRLSLIFEQLSSVASAYATLIGGGGALTHSPAWTQIISNALNQPIHLTEYEETTARGTALLALRAVGDTHAWSESPKIARVFTPDSEHVHILRKARQRQLDLYQKIIQ